MKATYVFISMFSLLVSLSASAAYADDHEHEAEGHEQHGAHEHGAATLSLAVGDEGMEIMLESPAANIVGFEHAASTEHYAARQVTLKPPPKPWGLTTSTRRLATPLVDKCI